MQSLRRAISGLRGCLEYRAEEEIIRAAAFGGFRWLQRVAGYADQKIFFPVERKHKLPGLLRRETALPKVHSASLRRKRYV